MKKRAYKKKTKPSCVEQNVFSISVCVVSVCISAVAMSFSDVQNSNARARSANDIPAPPCVDLAEDCTLDSCKRGKLLKSCRRTCGLCDRACHQSNATPAITSGYISHLPRRVQESYSHLSPTILSDDPVIIQFDNFLTETEAVAIDGQCDTGSRTRSLAGDQVSFARTSSQCWCQTEECMKNKHVAAVEDRISNLLGIPVVNAEFMQIVHYEKSQFYKKHHDQNAHPDTPQGPRIFTLFMYLNTPKEGGQTKFNDLGITVEAKQGRAILWPSVMDVDVTRADMRTHHEALPVLEGSKTGANLWFHMHDFRTLSRNLCSVTGYNTFNPDDTD